MVELTIPPGSGDAILGYVRAKAASWTVAEMLERVRAALTILEAAAVAVPEGDLVRVPEGEEWSPLDCVRHVTEINAATAIRCAEAAAPGSGRRVRPANWASLSREAALAEHAEALGVAFSRIERAGVDAATATWPHPFLGELNWREWLLTLRVHSLAHAEQLGALANALR